DGILPDWKAVGHRALWGQTRCGSLRKVAYKRSESALRALGAGGIDKSAYVPARFDTFYIFKQPPRHCRRPRCHGTLAKKQFRQNRCREGSVSPFPSEGITEKTQGDRRC